MRASPASHPDSGRRADGRRARGVRARAGPHPLRRPAGGQLATAFLRELDEFRPDLILSDYTLPRFDGMTALSLARERRPDAVPHRDRLGQRGDRGRLHEGGRHRLPAQEQPRPDRPGHRGGARPVPRPAEKARAEAALPPARGDSAPWFKTPPIWSSSWRRTAPSSTPATRPQRIVGYSPAIWSAAACCPISSGGRRADAARAAAERQRARPTASGPIEFCLRRGDGSPVWLETSRHQPAERCHHPRHRAERAGRQRAEAGRAGAPGERGALPRPVRQRQRPGLHGGAGRLAPVCEPGLAPRHRVRRRGARPHAAARPGASGQPGRVLQPGAASGCWTARRLDSCRAGLRAQGGHADHGRGQPQLHLQGRAAGRWSGASTATSPSGSGWRSSCAARSGCRPPASSRAAWRTRSTT